MKVEDIHNIYTHMTGRAEGMVMSGGEADFPVMFAEAILDYYKKQWVGLTDEEIDQGLLRSNHALQTAGAWRDGVEWATKQLKEKNT